MIERTITLPPDATSPGQARSFVRSALRPTDVDDDTIDTALLLTSELTTNAVLHARSDIDVTVRLLDKCLRIEIADENTRLPTPTFASVDALSGRGLNLVQAAATSWGIDSHDDGKIVWFELGNQPTSQASRK
jgi:anti-sigma regulatory factor (Ser/Thr protein kinase)